MNANPRFRNQPLHFWANVRTIGQSIGYTQKRAVRTYSLEDLAKAMAKSNLQPNHLMTATDEHTPLAEELLAYFEYRADSLNNYVEPRLMDAERAESVFKEHRTMLQPTCPLPMNKQRGEKRRHAYLTGLVNMIVEANSGGRPCDYDPRILTTVTRDDMPLRTLSRRVDGCFPSCVNPIAIWEVKEYYYTTSFGSRIADGVYETLLDGLELEELREHESIDIQHLLIVDAYDTWWKDGKSYLCRMIDMLHMGYVDEILFGYEVVEKLPDIVRNWVTQ